MPYPNPSTASPGPGAEQVGLAMQVGHALPVPAQGGLSTHGHQCNSSLKQCSPLDPGPQGTGESSPPPWPLVEQKDAMKAAIEPDSHHIPVPPADGKTELCSCQPSHPDPAGWGGSTGGTPACCVLRVPTEA